MFSIDTTSPVLVTGATGYVAGWIVKYLLEAGVTVHAAVRNASNKDKLKHLDEIAHSSPGKIKYFEADLLIEGSYAQAMQDCSIVFHTASPFTIYVKDPQKELVEPAKFGTHNVLTQATKIPSVKRVIITSSCAAIYSDNADLEKVPAGVFTEEIWNTSSSLTHNPYFFSKTEAEKEAWKIAESQSQWDLIAINPSLIMGPGLSPNATSESFKIIKQFGDGTMKRGVPDLGFGLVDVRDVATAHLAAAFTPEAKGRYIISAYNTNFLELAKQLIPIYGKDYPIPRKQLPKFLIWLIGPLLDPGMTRQYVSRNVGHPWKADNSKSLTDLGMKYRPLSETVNEFFEQMVQSGKFKK